MDRLVEVDKVTNLMRRRESPKQISPASLMCNSALSTRAFLEAKAYAPQSEPAPFAPLFRIPEPPRMSNVGDRYVAPKGKKFAGVVTSRRPDSSRIRITGSGSALQIPEPSRTLSAHITQAPMAQLRCRVPATSGGRRDFAMLRSTGIRVHTGEEPNAVRNLVLPGTAALGRNLPTKTIGAGPLEGKALRVSTALGFGPPATTRRVFLTPPAMNTALIWPKRPHQVLPNTRNAAAAAVRNLTIRITTLHTCLPAMRRGMGPTEFIYPGPKAPPKRKPVSKGLPPARTSDVSWILSDPRAGQIGIAATGAGFAKRNGVRFRSLTLAPAATNPAPHVAFRPFLPQEPVGCPQVPFEGTTAASIITAPVGGGAAEPSSAGPQAVSHAAAHAPTAVIKLEEHFGSGWGNWEGGVQDWLVDVAGVRTGSLALFLPTLELVDYDLEFLARIDTKSLTWVVRATDLQEYMRCTLTAIPGGELEFSRAVVRSGVAETVMVAPGRIPGKPRAAMTVRTQVSGDTFAVTVDGKAMDTWQEDRLYCGGIGFMGAPDDRARLYWVRISSTETIGKEHQKK